MLGYSKGSSDPATHLGDAVTFGTQPEEAGHHDGWRDGCYDASEEETPYPRQIQEIVRQSRYHRGLHHPRYQAELRHGDFQSFQSGRVEIQARPSEYDNQSDLPAENNDDQTKRPRRGSADLIGSIIRNARRVPAFSMRASRCRKEGKEKFRTGCKEFSSSSRKRKRERERERTCENYAARSPSRRVFSSSRRRKQLGAGSTSIDRNGRCLSLSLCLFFFPAIHTCSDPQHPQTWSARRKSATGRLTLR